MKNFHTTPMDKIRNIVIHTDGGSRGNPGASAIGLVIEEQGEHIYSCGKPIGIGTNNQAEYEAVRESLSWMIKNIPKNDRGTSLSFFLDSLLVVQQLKGVFKIKHPDLKIRADEIQRLMREVRGEVQFFHIPRAENSAADALVNQALDSGKEIIPKH